MKKLIIAIIALGMLTSATLPPASSGSWTFKSKHYTANLFKPHSYSLTAFDTTVAPRPKFIIDFHSGLPVASGKMTVVKGFPAQDDQISIATGISQGGQISFFSSTGGGKQTVNVTVSEGRITVSGAAIELANQNNIKDIAPVTFNITITP